MVRCQDLKGLPKLALRWAPGRWLGRVPDSDEDIVLTEFGIQNGRAVVPVHERDLPETLRAEALVKFLPGSTPTLRAPVDGAEEEPEPPAPLIPSGSGRTLTSGDYGPRAVALRDFHAARGHTAHCRACAEPGGKKHSHACRRRQWFWHSKRTAEQPPDGEPCPKRAETEPTGAPRLPLRTKTPHGQTAYGPGPAPAAVEADEPTPAAAEDFESTPTAAVKRPRETTQADYDEERAGRLVEFAARPGATLRAQCWTRPR
jgi:hypothetical protein